MSKFILTAIDIAHPETTKNILTKANALCQMENAQLAVISVIPDFGMSIVSSFFKEGTESQVLKLANEKLHEIVKIHLPQNDKVKHIIKNGNPYEEIIHTAKEINAEIIVMGAHRPELKDYLLGPNAARVVRHAQASVYVVRQ